MIFLASARILATPSGLPGTQGTRRATDARGRARIRRKEAVISRRIRHRKTTTPKSSAAVAAPSGWRARIAGAPAEDSPVLAFEVSDGRFAAPADPPSDGADRARPLFVDQPVRLDWTEGERIRVFEIEAPRRATRRMRVRGPSGLAWALFPPAKEAGWRPRAQARVTGFAGGSTSIELPAGVSALVLFHDAAAPPAGEIEIVLDEDTPRAASSAFLANAHELRRFVVLSLLLAFTLSLGEAGRTYLLTGNVWTTWGMVPIGTVFLLFPASFFSPCSGTPSRA